MLNSVLQQVMTDKPKIDINFLREVNLVKFNEKIEDIRISSITKTTTSLMIKFDFTLSKSKLKKAYLIKTNYVQNDNTYHSIALNESQFYSFINDHNITDLPIAKCYFSHIMPDKQGRMLILDDLSSDYSSAKTNLSDKNIWLTAASTLAKLHAKFWNKPPNLFKKKNNDIDQQIVKHRKTLAESLDKFVTYIKDKVSPELIDIYKHVEKLSNQLFYEKLIRCQDMENITLQHGDAHIYNFMFSKKHLHRALVTDFQFCNIGIACGDLAHLTRVNFADKFDITFHQDLVKNYYNNLLDNEVSNYSWENCWSDYRKHVACMLLIPMWQYSLFASKLENIQDDLTYLLKNFKELECENLQTNT